MIQFHYYNIYIYLLIRAIFATIRKDLETKNKEIIGNNSIILMFFGESLSIFLYFIEKAINKSQKNYFLKYRLEGKIKTSISSLNVKTKIRIIIIFCGILEIICSYDFSKKLNYDLIEKEKTLEGLNILLLGIFVYMNEYLYLNTQTYSHQQIGFVLVFLSSLIKLFSSIKNNKLFELNLLIYIILIIEKEYLHSMIGIFEKKLNYEYFVSIYKICGLEGIYGLIFYLCNYFYYNNIKEYCSQLMKIFYSPLSVLPFIISVLIYNLCRLKIAEKTRPSYNTIGYFINNLFLNIFNVSGKNDIWTVQNIVCTILSMIGAVIFCEVITLKCYDLDKNTIYETISRGKIDTCLILETSSNENSFSSW